MAKPRTSGGKDYRRFLRASKANLTRGPHEIHVGFLSRQISVLAIRLEFGDPRSNLPERPAYRQGVEDLHRALPGVLLRVLKTSDPARDGVWHMTTKQAWEVGMAAREVLRESYLRFAGPGLSERQERRKAGTVGEGRELVGHEGPKLLDHLEVAVDGQRIG